MSNFSDLPLLPAPDAPDPALRDSDDHDGDAQHGERDGGEADGERAVDPAMPEAVANNYRFAGLVTLIPEDAASVDRLA